MTITRRSLLRSLGSALAALPVVGALVKLKPEPPNPRPMSEETKRAFDEVLERTEFDPLPPGTRHVRYEVFTLPTPYRLAAYGEDSLKEPDEELVALVDDLAHEELVAWFREKWGPLAVIRWRPEAGGPWKYGYEYPPPTFKGTPLPYEKDIGGRG